MVFVEMIVYTYTAYIGISAIAQVKSAYFDLISAVQHTHLWYHGFIYTRDYSEQLWFPLNEIHQPQLRVNQGKPQLQL